MSGNVTLTYKRVGEKFEGKFSLADVNALPSPFKDFDFAQMMTVASRLLKAYEAPGLIIQRTDRPGMLPVQLEPKLFELLLTDPVAYIKANSIAPRVLDLRAEEKQSALAAGEKHVMPRSAGLRHGQDALASAFGERLYTRAKILGVGHWRYEHPGTGRWADLVTIEHWLKSRETRPVFVDEKRGYLVIATELLLQTKSERFYYPREWNTFGSWITKEQLREKLEQFRKDKSNVR